MSKIVEKLNRTILPLALGVFILYWVYHDFNFEQAGKVLRNGTNWWWMAVSLLFGILSHVLRGWRWLQTLAPLQLYPKSGNCVDAIFVSYAANLLLPRVGEVSRCGILHRYDKLPFAPTLGTVVTERIVDALLMLLVIAFSFLLQMPVFFRFFHQTGMKIPSAAYLLTTPWFYVSLFIILSVGLLLYRLLHALSLLERVKNLFLSMFQGIMSLRNVQNKSLFVSYTVAIWLCYFLHFYLTFYCFGFSEDLGLAAGLVMFAAGTFAVIVPTPNGAGPWHFAVITMMMLYGVSASDAAVFALIVHSVQTLLVVVLGIYGCMHLVWTNRAD